MGPVEVLATTRLPVVPYYHISNQEVDMPVAWTKFWGNGRVFYNSLGHHDDVFDKFPEAENLMEQGMLWAAEGKQYARNHGLIQKSMKVLLRLRFWQVNMSTVKNHWLRPMSRAASW